MPATRRRGAGRSARPVTRPPGPETVCPQPSPAMRRRPASGITPVETDRGRPSCRPLCGLPSRRASLPGAGRTWPKQPLGCWPWPAPAHDCRKEQDCASSSGRRSRTSWRSSKFPRAHEGPRSLATGTLKARLCATRPPLWQCPARERLRPTHRRDRRQRLPGPPRGGRAPRARCGRGGRAAQARLRPGRARGLPPSPRRDPARRRHPPGGPGRAASARTARTRARSSSTT